MKMVKSLILGSAAGLIAMSGAQAADLPLKAKAVEYVRICSLYGAGFFYIPGTDTCIKLGGYLRVETAFNTTAVYGGAYSGQAGAQNRLSNFYTARSREDLNIDTRTATEYGVVRTFFDATFSWTSGAYSGNGLGGTFYSAAAQSGGFGGGVSASVSAEDATAYDQASLANLSAGLVSAPGFLGGSLGVSDLGGSRSPNFVGKVVVDQAWGLAQLSVAAHDNHAGYYGATEFTGHPTDKWGWAVKGALSIKNIPTGPGDTLNFQAVYTDGASNYNFQNLAPHNFAMFGGTNVPGAYQSVGLAAVADGVFANGTGISTVQTWGLRGAYTHNWSPYWNTAIYGAYAQLKYGNGGTALVCAALAGLGAATAGITTCNPDFNVGQIGLITRWTPVKNLTFSADVTYSNLDQKFAGTIAPATAAAGIAKPAAVYELKDQNTVSLLIRAQRNW